MKYNVTLFFIKKSKNLSINFDARRQLNNMDRVIYTGWRRVLDDENDPSTWKDEYHQVHYYEDAQRDPGDGVLEIELFEDGSGDITIKNGVTWIAVEQAIKHFRNVIIPQQVAGGYVERDRLWKSLKIEIEAAKKSF